MAVGATPTHPVSSSADPRASFQSFNWSSGVCPASLFAQGCLRLPIFTSRLQNLTGDALALSAIVTSQRLMCSFRSRNHRHTSKMEHNRSTDPTCTHATDGLTDGIADGSVIAAPERLPTTSLPGSFRNYVETAPAPRTGMHIRQAPLTAMLLPHQHCWRWTVLSLRPHCLQNSSSRSLLFCFLFLTSTSSSRASHQQATPTSTHNSASTFQLDSSQPTTPSSSSEYNHLAASLTH